jgi:hypothetical protein
MFGGQDDRRTVRPGAPRIVAGLMARSSRLRDSGQTRRALRVARLAQRLHPRDPDVLLGLAMLLAEGELEESRALIRAAAANAESDAGMLTRCAGALLDLGGGAEIAPWVARAEELADEGFALADDLVFLRGCVLHYEGKHEAAEPVLRAAFFAAPTLDYGYHLADTYVESDATIGRLPPSRRACTTTRSSPRPTASSWPGCGATRSAWLWST